MKKKIILITLIIAFLSVNIASADVSAPNFFKKLGNNVTFIQSALELGSSSARVAKGWFTNLDATNATIGTLQISSQVSPGPLVVAASTNPTIRFTGDTDTGIGWLAANKMSLMTNNTDRLTVDATGNVGIGTTSPGQKLEINGGLRLNTATAKPTCSSTTRGTIWHVFGAAGVADTVETCVKDAADAYSWKTLY